MLGYVFNQLLPVGHKAWRMNMMSALMGSAGAAALHSTVARLSGSLWAALYTAVSFAFNSTVWLYSTQGEVFGLNNMLVCLMALLTINFYTTLHANKAPKADNSSRNSHTNRSSSSSTEAQPTADAGAAKIVRAACQGAFVSGLAMTNQHTTVFYVFVTVLFVTWAMWGRNLISWRVTAWLFVSLFTGMSPYLYMPIRAGTEDSWGDQTSLGGFMHHFLRAEYGTFQLAADSISEDPGMWSRLCVYWTTLHQESAYAAPMLGLFGLYHALRSPYAIVRDSSHVFLWSYVMYVLVFHKLANLDLSPLFLGVQARFWMQANVYVSVFAGFGLHQLVHILVNRLTGADKAAAATHQSKRSSGKGHRGKQQTRVLEQSSTGRTAMGLAALALCVLQIGINWRYCNHHGEDGFYNHGESVLQGFPQDSLVLLNGDLNNNLMKYPNQCEGVRPDLRLVSVQLMTWEWFVPMQARYYPGVVFPGDRFHPRKEGGFSFKQFLDANKGFDTFICGPVKEGDNSHEATYEIVPFGMCSQIVPKGYVVPDMFDHMNRSWRAMPRLHELGQWSDKFGDETWEKVMFNDWFHRLVFLTGYAAFHSNQQMSNGPLRKVAKEMVDYMFSEDVLPQLKAADAVRVEDYRGAGIILGQYTDQVWQELGEADPEGAEQQINELEARMFALWETYGRLQLARGQEDDLAMYTRDRVNPYYRRPKQ